MDSAVYRRATRDDADQLADLRWIHQAEEQDVSAFDRDAFVERFRAFLDRELDISYACWVAAVGGRLVSNIYIGMLDKVPKPGAGAARVGYVTNVHTLDEYRNRGIGSGLMAGVQAWARDNGFELLFVWPSQRSIPFYQRLGFEGENDVMECDL